MNWNAQTLDLSLTDCNQSHMKKIKKTGWNRADFCWSVSAGSWYIQWLIPLILIQVMTFLALCYPRLVLIVLCRKKKLSTNPFNHPLKNMHTHTCTQTRRASHCRNPPFVKKALLLLYSIIIGNLAYFSIIPFFFLLDLMRLFTCIFQLSLSPQRLIHHPSQLLLFVDGAPPPSKKISMIRSLNSGSKWVRVEDLSNPHLQIKEWRDIWPTSSRVAACHLPRCLAWGLQCCQMGRCNFRKASRKQPKLLNFKDKKGNKETFPIFIIIFIYINMYICHMCVLQSAD